ncbi:hypothetical protein [Streptomyces sp. NRRL F-2664]|uniref:hypothetical protein n=1 Tax=Streptomyces sp. NRRL F-2664 TaxID=1463842 RepID=UPI0004CAEE60|nr:hypothetical protein [Streptomyces sp. NRRL F-2664]
MTRHGQGHEGRRRTTPSQAPGESGDREARREADEAVVGGPGGSGSSGAGGHSAKQQRPGTGREEQTRPQPPRDDRTPPGAEDG